MKRRLPPLNALRVFEVSARLLSFQQAASELNVTHSAVSHQIKKLEQELDAELFVRMGRRVMLSELGERYYQDIHAALHLIASSTEDIFCAPGQGQLTVQFYMGIASRWLMSRLGRFRQLYPSIHLELFTTYFQWGFEKNSSDLGVIYAEERDASLSYDYLFKGKLIPVCSPDFFPESGCMFLSELLSQAFLKVTESPNNLSHWLHHQGGKNEADICIKEEFDNYQMALEAAIAGQGVVIVPAFFGCADIASKKLVVPMQQFAPEIGSWYLVSPNGSRENSRVNYFIHWFRSVLEQDAVLQGYLCHEKETLEKIPPNIEDNVRGD